MAKRHHNSGHGRTFSAYPSRIANGLSFDQVLRQLQNPLPDLLINTPSAVRSQLSEIEDGRYFHPDQDERPVASTRRWNVATQINQKTESQSRASWLGLKFSDVQSLNFSSPKFVATCIRRNERKEVLHALGKVGKGSGSRFRRRNAKSNVRC